MNTHKCFRNWLRGFDGRTGTRGKKPSRRAGMRPFLETLESRLAPATLNFLTPPVNTPTGVLMQPVTVELSDPYRGVITTDNSDTVVLGIASGPGSFLAGSTTSATMVNGVATFNNLTLVVPGSYTFSESVPGQYSGPNSAVFNVTQLAISPSTLPAGDNGTPYSQTISASGGTAPYTFARTTGTLPPGLTLSSTGVLSGMPSAAATFVFTITATDSQGHSGSQQYTLIVTGLVLNPMLSVVPKTISSGPAGTVIEEDVYLNNPDPAGGVGPLVGFSLVLTYDPAALMFATGMPGPNLPADWTFREHSPTPGQVVIGSAGTTGGSAQDAVTGPAPLELVSLDFLIIGTTAESTPIEIVDSASTSTGTANTDVDGVGGLFDPGLPGQVSGLQLTAPGSGYKGNKTGVLPNVFLYGGGNGSAQATAVLLNGGNDPNGDPFTGFNVWAPGYGYTSAPTVTIDPPPGAGTQATAVAIMSPYPIGAFVPGVDTMITILTGSSLAISPATLPAGEATVAYQQTLSATGGTAPYQFAVPVGTLPPGLTLNGSTGVLSGTPTAAGTYTFTVSATDAATGTGTQSYSLAISSAVALTPANLASGTVSTSYQQTITTSGGTGPFTLTTTSGTLPPGLTLSSAGVLAGTPTAVGNFSFTVSVSDNLGGSASRQYTVIITAIGAPIVLGPTSLPDGMLLTPYSQTITASGGAGPYAFTLTAGTLPTGLTLSSSGVLSGKPNTSQAAYTFTVTATDTAGASGSQSYTITIDKPSGLLSLPTAGYSGSQGFPVMNFPVNVSALNDGTHMGLTAATIILTFPTGVFDFPVGTNCATQDVNLGSILLSNGGAPNWSVTANSPADGVLIVNVSANPGDQISSTTGGSLVTINFPVFANPPAPTPETIVLIAQEGSTHTSVVGSNGTYTAALLGLPTSGVITIDPLNGGALSLDPNLQTIGDVGTPYTQIIFALGGMPPYMLAMSSGALPPGLTLSTSGVLAGTPTAAGVFTFTVMANDSGGQTASQSYTVTINAAPAVPPPPIPNGAAGAAYQETFQVTGGTAPYTFSSSGTLPTGLSLDSSMGVLSGTPTTAGTFNFAITATDSVKASASQNYTVTVTPGSLAGYNVSVIGSSEVTAGTSFLVNVQAADSFGNPITSYSGPSNVAPSLNPSSAGTIMPASVSINQFGLGLFLATIPKVDTYTISAASGSFTGASSTITVVPGPATKLRFGVQPQSTPTGVTLPAVTVQVLDAYGNVVTGDNTDIVTIGIASGPGSFTSSSTTTAMVQDGVATFNNLTLVTPGAYALSELVNGLYTGPASSTFTIAPLQVLPGSFVGTVTGFTAQFNAPYLVNSTTPTEYGTGFGLLKGQNGQPPTVFLTTDRANLQDTLAYVPGTVILNTSNNSLQFIETDTTTAANTSYAYYTGSSNVYPTPILPDGTYYAVIRGTNNVSPSGIKYNGLQALNADGGFLDGTNSGTPGHDFIATFTLTNTASGADAVWVPATADGPLQVLTAPGNNNQALFNGGMPVYLDDTTGNVSSVTGTFSYNPTLLTVMGGSASLANTTFTVTMSTPGVATFTYTDATGVNKSKLTGGVGSNNALIPGGSISAPALGFINATVPNSSASKPIYKAKDVLTISNVQINGGSTIPVVGGMVAGTATTSSAVHLVAYVGDGDGNGSYNSADAVITFRVLCSTDSGFAAYPLVDPTIVADTDGSGFIPSDAALQVNEAGVGFSTANLANPPIPSGAKVSAIGNNVDPQLSLVLGPSSFANVHWVSVNLDDAHPAGSTGLVRADLALTYDPTRFTVSAADVHAGSVLQAGSGWSVVPTIDPVTGQIGIALSSDTPISRAIGGSLVTIDFHSVGGNAKAPAIALVSSVTPNGQIVATELEDAQGTFTLFLGNSVVQLTDTDAGLSAPIATVLVKESTTATSEPTSANQGLSPAFVDTFSAGSTVIAKPDDVESAPTPVVEAAPLHVGTAPVQATAPMMAAAASLSLAAVPLTGMVFPLAGTPLAVVPANAMGWQRLADQLFQTLARTAWSMKDPAVVGMAQSLEQTLNGQPFRARSLLGDPDSMIWNIVDSYIDWYRFTRQPGRPTREDNESNPPMTMTPGIETVTTHAVMEQLFSQDADARTGRQSASKPCDHDPSGGHGGNRLLRRRDPRHFRFTILQLVAPVMESGDATRLEASWKQRLHTREPYGLNDN